MVGKSLKQSKYNIFNSQNEKYYLSYNYKLNEKTKKMFKLAGAVIIVKNNLI
jgi:hypothetical protein